MPAFHGSACQAGAFPWAARYSASPFPEKRTVRRTLTRTPTTRSCRRHQSRNRHLVYCAGVASFVAARRHPAHNRLMAWEWVAPVATAGTGTFGVFFTWLSGKQGRDHAERTAREQLAQQRLLAQDARDQERLENAYLELLRMVEGLGQWVQHVHPSVDLGSPIKNPPTVDEQARTQALVNAFGSDRVKDLLNEWRKFLREAISLAVQIDSEEERQSAGPDPDNRISEMIRELLPQKPGDVQRLKALLENVRPGERDARRALTSQVAAELRHNVESNPEQTRTGIPALDDAPPLDTQASPENPKQPAPRHSQ